MSCYIGEKMESPVEVDKTESVDDVCNFNEENGFDEVCNLHEENGSFDERLKEVKDSLKEVNIEKEDDYDTDLEIQGEKINYDLTGKKIYEECCHSVNVVPASFFIRHMQKPTIFMPHHGIGEQGAQAISISLVSNTSVLELNLEDNSIGSIGAAYLAEMMKENIYLTELNIAGNNIGNSGAQAICDMLMYNCTLQKLNLSGNNIDDNSGKYFVAALLENNRLGDLNLSHNSLGGGWGMMIGQALAENVGLEVLNVSWNNLRKAYAVEIIDGIKNSPRLKEVNLSWNGLGDEGALAVADCLRNNHLLRILDVSSNRISPNGAFIITKGLEINETLVHLSLSNNPIKAAGAFSILKSIHNEVSGMEELNLEGIEVDKAFNNLLMEMQSSRNLVVTHSGILSNYEIKGIYRKDKDVRSDITMEELEQKLSDNKMFAVKVALGKHQEKIRNILNEFDKEKILKITLADLKKGFTEIVVSNLTELQLAELLSNIAKREKDGAVSYSEIVTEIQEIYRPS